MLILFENSVKMLKLVIPLDFKLKRIMCVSM